MPKSTQVYLSLFLIVILLLNVAYSIAQEPPEENTELTVQEATTTEDQPNSEIISDTVEPPITEATENNIENGEIETTPPTLEEETLAENDEIETTSPTLEEETLVENGEIETTPPTLEEETLVENDEIETTPPTLEEETLVENDEIEIAPPTLEEETNEPSEGSDIGAEIKEAIITEDVNVILDNGTTEQSLEQMSDEAVAEVVEQGFDPYHDDNGDGIWDAFATATCATVAQIAARTGQTVTSVNCNITATPLASAIADATAGSTIFVEAGTYNEAAFTVNKSITLLGPNAGIAGTGTRAAEAVITNNITITGDNVRLDGFTFQDSGISGADYQVNIRANNVTVQNNRILGPGWMPAGLDYAIFVTLNGRTGISVLDNYIDNWRQAMNVSSGGEVNFSNNVVTEVKGGIVASNPLNLTVSGNSFSGTTGAPAFSTSGVVIAGNGSGNATITNNTISNFNEAALKIQSSGGGHTITTSGNTFTDNDYGIAIFSNSGPTGPTNPHTFGPDTFINSGIADVFYIPGSGAPITINGIFDDGVCDVAGTVALTNCVITVPSSPATPSDSTTPNSGSSDSSNRGGGTPNKRYCTNNLDFVVFITDERDFDIFRVSGSEGLAIGRYIAHRIDTFKIQNPQRGFFDHFQIQLPERNETMDIAYLGNDLWQFDLKSGNTLIRTDYCVR